jgi:hypothetical protein
MIELLKIVDPYNAITVNIFGSLVTYRYNKLNNIRSPDRNDIEYLNDFLKRMHDLFGNNYNMNKYILI